VDHLEYQCIGQAGQTQAISLEEGLAWEGLKDEDAEEEETNWRDSLSDI
jgi:hypothetical protein